VTKRFHFRPDLAYGLAGNLALYAVPNVIPAKADMTRSIPV
jgi:hypothetical protein